VGQVVEAVRQGFTQLIAHKLRSALTLLGIFIGIAAIIGSSTLLDAVNRMVIGMFERYGKLNVMAVEAAFGVYRNGRWHRHAKMYSLDENDGRALREAFPEVTDLSLAKWENDTLSYGGASYPDTSIQGVSERYGAMNNLTVKRGRFLTESDIAQWARIAILSARLEEDLFSGRNPLGEEVLIGKQRFSVVGVLHPLGSDTSEERAVVYIPYTTHTHRLYGKQGFLGFDWGLDIYLQVEDAGEIEKLQVNVKHFLKRRHRGSTLDHFRTWSVGEWQAEALDNLKVQGYILYAVAALCLLTGGIGIMNIMLVSVSERTREIGLRKAVGAKNRDILAQFLIEAVVLSLVGGLLGIVGGWGVGEFLSKILKATMEEEASLLSVQLHLSTVAVALGTASGIALVFGIFPALKAARLSPIDALRYE
jgi:ABC-type antimicrobial peptide transport system permease subunit